MKLVDLKVEQFVSEVASKNPAPGGGSVAALSSALGSALALMVNELTITKKKFKALPPYDQEDFTSAVSIIKHTLPKLLVLIDSDTQAFNQIMQAFSLPKTTQSEVDARNKQIETATLVAIDVPKQVINTSLLALRQLYLVLQHGNTNALSDIGVSALLLASGIEGAILNVKINAKTLPRAYAKPLYDECESTLAESLALKSNILTTIHQHLSIDE